MDNLITIEDGAAILKMSIGGITKLVSNGHLKLYSNKLSIEEVLKEKQETEDAWVKVKEIFAEAYENKTYFD